MDSREDIKVHVFFITMTYYAYKQTVSLMVSKPPFMNIFITSGVDESAPAQKGVCILTESETPHTSQMALSSKGIWLWSVR